MLFERGDTGAVGGQWCVGCQTTLHLFKNAPPHETIEPPAAMNGAEGIGACWRSCGS